MFLNFKQGIGICLQSIMENSGISQKLKCKYEMQQHVNNNVAKNRVFQSLSTHGWMSIEHWRQFFIAKSINIFCIENTLFIHAAQKCVSRRKNLKIVSGRQQQKVERRHQEGHQDMTSSSLSHS